MSIRSEKIAFGLVLLGLAAMSCGEPPQQPTRISSGAAALIQDGAHNGGNEHFYWLAPMVKAPTVSGVFDVTLSPEVEICVLTAGACSGPLVATFSMAAANAWELVKVDPLSDGGHYMALWHTDLYNLDPLKTYRIRVLVEGVELGLADVDVVTSGKELRNVNTGEHIPLKDGRTLPIKFRIEQGAITKPTFISYLYLLPEAGGRRQR